MSLSGKHIVAIDDTHSILTFLRISLEALGARFTGAATAAGGLALCESQKPDLVVLDLGLPDKEGLDILPQLKRIDRSRKLPVIILTVRKEAQSRELAIERGVDAYLTKPFIMDELLGIIQKLLGTRPYNLAPDEKNQQEREATSVPSDSRSPVQ